MGFSNLFKLLPGSFVSAEPQSNHEPDGELGLIRLESRILLSGNVIASFLGTDISLVGDADDNFVELEIVDNRLVATGIDGTTVNGAAQVTLAEGVGIDGSLSIIAAGGNDEFFLDNGLNIGGNVYFQGDSGADKITLDGIQIGGFAHLDGGGGDDQIVTNTVGVGGSMYVSGGRGEDVFAARLLDVGFDLIVSAGEQSDRVILENSLVDDHLYVYAGNGDDDIVVRNSSILRNVFVFDGDGADVTVFENGFVGRFTFVFAQSGDDIVDIRGPGRFRKRVSVIGDAATDAVRIDGRSFINKRTILAGALDGSDVQALASRIDSADTGLVVLANQLQNNLTTPQSLALDVSSNAFIQSSGTLLVDQPIFTLNGMTTPQSRVSADLDGDGIGDISTVADDEGGFSLQATLDNTAENLGANRIAVSSTNDDNLVSSETVAVHYAVGTVARISTAFGDIDVELLDEAAPQTVRNFLSYLPEYQGSIVHRSAFYDDGDNFVIQGGGFRLEDDQVVGIPVNDPVPSEAGFDRSNVRGTLAVALPIGNPDGGTSQWFINMNDRNQSLDNSFFTVFGRVIGSGLEVADAIQDLDIFDLSDEFGQTALQEVPLADYEEFGEVLAGTVSGTAGSTLLIGEGTQFTTELPVDRVIRIDGQVFQAAQVVSDSELVLEAAPTIGFSGATVQYSAQPAAENYVTIERVEQLFD